MKKIYLAAETMVVGDYLVIHDQCFIRKVDKELDPDEAKFLMEYHKMILTEADHGN